MLRGADALLDARQLPEGLSMGGRPADSNGRFRPEL